LLKAGAIEVGEEVQEIEGKSLILDQCPELYARRSASHFLPNSHMLIMVELPMFCSMGCPMKRKAMN